MKKTVKLMAVLGAVAITASSLAGCGGNKTETSSGEGLALLNETGLPIAKEEVTLEVAVQKAPHVTNFEKMPMLQELEEKTNVKIKWRELPSDSFNEKVNLMIASADFPDIMWRKLNELQLTELSSKGVVYPLDDLIEKYAPRWVEHFKNVPYAKRISTALDGHIYSLPYIRQEEANSGFRDVTFINKDWLDALGLEVPKTTEEFKNVLKAFKEKDPNGNGQNDELPWSFVYNSGSGGELDIYGSFGLIDVPERIAVRDGKVLFTAVQPENNEAVSYLNSIYKDGTIYIESFVQNSTQLNAKIKAQPSLVGVYSAYGMSHDPAVQNYVPLPPLTGPSGVKPQVRRQLNVADAGNFTIFKNNKYPEISMRWANELADPEFGVKALYSPLEKAEDGTYNTLSSDPTALAEHPINFGPFVVLKEEVEKVKGNTGKDKREEFYQVYKDYTVAENEMFPLVWYTPEQREVFNQYRTEIIEYVKTTRAKWITEGGIEEDWDGFVKKLDDMGLQKVMDVYQSGYDDFYSK